MRSSAFHITLLCGAQWRASVCRANMLNSIIFKGVSQYIEYFKGMLHYHSSKRRASLCRAGVLKSKSRELYNTLSVYKGTSPYLWSAILGYHWAGPIESVGPERICKSFALFVECKFKVRVSSSRAYRVSETFERRNLEKDPKWPLESLVPETRKELQIIRPIRLEGKIKLRVLLSRAYRVSWTLELPLHTFNVL